LPNRLAGESSPYLLQHAHNPVDWYPWGPEAFERARTEEKPILLSVGYSACHWCHVMERESFEDAAVAALMNEAFVNVKVDREERPDVDAIYMRAVQALTGHGGWPLTAFLTPAGEPYYGGTYFPPEPRRGMPSFRQVLDAVREAWVHRRDEVHRAAGEMRGLLERSITERPVDESGEGLSPGLTEAARRNLANRFDPRWGGFGSAPKFPQPVTLEFLLRHHRATGHPEALAMVHHTLIRMARGGMRDHVGGGFHRYSVYARWLVPHFEKMLYDNALLARLYAQAWQVTGDEELRAVAESTLDWILEDMRAPGHGGAEGRPTGGFYAARDADSEGEEGLFYLWTPDEVEGALEPRDAGLFNEVYDVTPEGNFEGRSIPHLAHGLEAAARARGMSVQELSDRLASLRSALRRVRSGRPAPLRDEKVLAGWNGMAVRAFAEAGGAFGREDYVEAAREALTWLLDALRPEGPDGPVLHVWTDGEAKIPAFLEDVAALGNAALTLHEVTLEPEWRHEVRRMAARVVEDFWDEETGAFYDVGSRECEARELIVRPRDPTDSATPSGTSLAVELCLRAGHLFGKESWTAVGRRALTAEVGSLRRFPSAFGRLLALAQGELEPPLELAVIGRPADPDARALLEPLLRRYVPGRTVTGRSPDEADPDEQIPLLAGRGLVQEKPAAYLCRGYACERPVTDPTDLEALLEAEGSGADPGQRTQRR
jgi:uncharacterized protein YyaL (SSP411 family)